MKEAKKSINIKEIINTLISIAKSAETKFRNLLLLLLLNTAWITFYVSDLFNFTLTGSIITLTTLMPPVLFSGYVYWSILQILDLPNVITDIKYSANDSFSRGKEIRQSKQKFKFKNLLSIASILKDLSSIPGHSQDIASTLGGAMLIANPLSVILLMITVGFAMIATFSSIVTSFIYWA